ncbi:amidohydrolase [Cereibacter sphaeroides]|uniref:amidohydrolase n=1 Tax=Cereibacter sphaeroides TaxID=1063 RepID=UPI001F4065E7|nr:amidohydrolase [Cereibacter sphaeroides]MCE6967433.1 amidohydrolase [Cereibacter sphaeroides]
MTMPKHRLSRRALLLLSMATLVAPVALARPVRAQEGPADRIFLGGPILTMNDAQSSAEAVAVKDGRILAVGDEVDVLGLRGDATEVIDLGGRALLPGFFDAHGHVFVGGIQALTANMLAPPDGDVTNIPSLQQVLRDWIAAHEEAVKKTGLIMGFGFDKSTLAELRNPNRADLDAITTEYPVYLIHQSGHLGAANSKALEIAGITRDSENPPGGVIEKDANGEPTGVLEENAHNVAWMTLMGAVDRDGMKAIARAGAELWAKYGYTTAEEGRSLQATADIMKEVGAEGGFKIDVLTYVDVLMARDYVKENVSPDYENRFRVAGAKLTIDGSPQGFTAYRDRPYFDPVGAYPPGYRGYASATQEQADDAIDWAFANGVQIITHANGEAAGDMLIAGLDAATKTHGADATRRPVIIHGQFMREDQVDSYRRLNVIPSLFPMHTFYWGDWHRDHTVGPELADNISPTGWLVKRGMVFSTHHDAPVAFPNSMRVLDATVTRRSRSGDIIGPAQRVDLMTALKAMTIWPAYHHFEEGHKGSIEVGKLADLVILSGDPTAIDPEELDTLTVAETIKEGTTIYVAGQKGGLLEYRPLLDGTNPLADALRKAALQREKIMSSAPDDLRLAGKYDAQGASVTVPGMLAEVLGHSPAEMHSSH